MLSASASFFCVFLLLLAAAAAAGCCWAAQPLHETLVERGRGKRKKQRERTGTGTGTGTGDGDGEGRIALLESCNLLCHLFGFLVSPCCEVGVVVVVVVGVVDIIITLSVVKESSSFVPSMLSSSCRLSCLFTYRLSNLGICEMGTEGKEKKTAVR